MVPSDMRQSANCERDRCGCCFKSNPGKQVRPFSRRCQRICEGARSRPASWHPRCTSARWAGRRACRRAAVVQSSGLCCCRVGRRGHAQRFWWHLQCSYNGAGAARSWLPAGATVGSAGAFDAHHAGTGARVAVKEGRQLLGHSAGQLFHIGDCHRSVIVAGHIMADTDRQ